MTRKLPQPTPSQWPILETLAETGGFYLTKDGARFCGPEQSPRSFAFVSVMHLILRGYAHVPGPGVARIEPTPLCHRVLAARAADRAKSPDTKNKQHDQKDRP